MAEIVVAHESEAIREAICRLCADAGYAVHAEEVPAGTGTGLSFASWA